MIKIKMQLFFVDSTKIICLYYHKIWKLIFASVVPYGAGTWGSGLFAPSSGPSKMRHGGGRLMPEGMDSY